MRNKGKAGNRFWVVLILGMLFGSMLLGRTCLAAEEASRSGNKEFDIDARLLSQDDIYTIQLTLHNRGEDWEGTVRVSLENNYDSLNCVYDTVISLPQGSTKQFAVSIPVNSVEDRSKTVKVTLLDKKGRVAAEKGFKRFLLDGADSVSLGILSDSYRALTYLDMGGEGVVYYGGVEYPIDLVELDQDNLMGSLDLLTFLVIDDYNTGFLADAALERIQEWVDRGGMLIVGTGEHAEETLSGLDFLDVECVRINEPAENVSESDGGGSLEQLTLAELKDSAGRYNTDKDSMIMVSSWGDGAVELVPYALSDLGDPDQVINGWDSYVWELLHNANNYVKNLDYYSSYYDLDYIIRGIFRSFGNCSGSLNFGVLKWIVVLYAVFVGPILYLILRAMKRRDWYWGAVPATVLVGVLLVYFAGRGFEVVNTRVYSVTVEKLSGQNTGKSLGNVTYLHCYDADYREWELRLAERYDYAGPVFGNFYYGAVKDKYHYRICREGDRVFLGMNPDRGFEDGYFVAGTSQNMETGTISSDLTTSALRGITGTVTNGTSRDFQYFAVINDNVLYIYENLPAGETHTLEQVVYTSGQQSYDTLIEAYRHDYMSDYVFGRRGKDYDEIAALGTGIWEVFSREDLSGTVIIGVTRNWEKAVDDDCGETAYGCLYAVQ